MPTSIDLLKAKRDSGYGSDSAPPSGGMDRSFKLTPEEMQGIGQPGGSVTCQVTGTLSPDGKLTVESVSAPGGGGYDKPMPVMPPSQISPS